MTESSQVRVLLGHVLANARDLKRIKIDSVLEAEILTCLVEGRRTVGELADQIYHAKRTDQSYHTYYMKIRRAVSELQKKGYIATNFLGKEKPYRLTPYAISVMLDVGDPDPHVIPFRDKFVYVSTLVLGLFFFFLSGFSHFLSRPYMILVYTILVFLTGISACRLSIAFKKVR